MVSNGVRTSNKVVTSMYSNTEEESNYIPGEERAISFGNLKQIIRDVFYMNKKQLKARCTKYENLACCVLRVV
jgi:hypothetical protein